MKGILLDTHIFLWWTSEPERLPPRIREALESPRSKILLSLASAWEMQIKIGIGKLSLTESLESLIMREVEINGLALLPIGLSHVLELGKFPPLHRDPFDRMLVAQARVENLRFATLDRDIERYPGLEFVS